MPSSQDIAQKDQKSKDVKTGQRRKRRHVDSTFPMGPESHGRPGWKHCFCRAGTPRGQWGHRCCCCRRHRTNWSHNRSNQPRTEHRPAEERTRLRPKDIEIDAFIYQQHTPRRRTELRALMSNENKPITPGQDDDPDRIDDVV